MNSSVGTVVRETTGVEEETEKFIMIRKPPVSRRIVLSDFCSSPISASSFRSLSSSNYTSSHSPTSPLPCFSRVPFSWEQQPGVPKHSNFSSEKMRNSSDLLPLPPIVPHISPKKPVFDAFTTRKKKKNIESYGDAGDPFLAALVECSKDRERSANSKINSVAARTFGDRFNFFDIYASCKRTNSIIQSTILIRRSNRHSYGQLKHRS